MKKPYTKNITRERLLDIASQLEGIIKELSEASEALEPRKRRDLKSERVAKHYNRIKSKML